jgi:nucleoside-diphosphate-sugar epimerase
MKILLTGATGFLGSHLARALLNSGHQVIIFKRSFSNTHRVADILPQMSAYDLDRCELDLPFRDHGPIDAVIHTATCYGRKGEKITDVFEANTAFPLRLLETARANGTDIFLNTDTRLPKFLNGYALTKKQFAEWGKHYSGQGTLRFVNLEIEHFYGPGDDSCKFTTLVITNCIADSPELQLTKGEQKRDFVYVDDVVTAYLTVLDAAREGDEPFYHYEVGSGTVVTIREFVETVHRLTSSRTILKFGSIPYRENEVMETQADVSALRSLGWSSQVGLVEGLTKTIQVEKRANRQ